MSSLKGMSMWTARRPQVLKADREALAGSTAGLRAFPMLLLQVRASDPAGDAQLVQVFTNQGMERIAYPIAVHSMAKRMAIICFCHWSAALVVQELPVKTRRRGAVGAEVVPYLLLQILEFVL